MGFSENELVFGMYFYPHYFRSESPVFHLRICREANSNLYLAVQAPRGSSKSTLMGFLKPSHKICFKKSRFRIIVQNTYAKAASSLENIKKEFKDNEKLKRSFGIVLRKDAEGDTIFRHLDGFETRVLCKGADQLGSIRGERFGAYRPDAIDVDDLEDDEMVKNPERRMELEKQFNEVLKYAGEHKVTKIHVIGTILHDDSLLAKLLSKDNYKHFKKLFYKARNEKGEEKVSLWPQKWSLADLEEMEKDDPSGFAKEMQGDPSSGSLETIRRQDFRYWKIENNCAVLFNQDFSVKARWDLKDCKAAIACDLAWEEGQANDFSAIVPGFCTPDNDILVDDYIARRGMRPDELENIIFDLSDKYARLTGKRVPVGFEKAKLEKVMKWFLKEAQKRRNQWLWLKDISWGTKDKIERILARLGNRYAQHSVYHKKGMGDLENQMIRLRSVKNDDIADATGMLPEMLSFAPSKKKEVKSEESFNWWRKQTPIYREKQKKNYLFGQKIKASCIKTIKACV